VPASVNRQQQLLPPTAELADVHQLPLAVGVLPAPGVDIAGVPVGQAAPKEPVGWIVFDPVVVGPAAGRKDGIVHPGILRPVPDLQAQPVVLVERADEAAYIWGGAWNTVVGLFGETLVAEPAPAAEAQTLTIGNERLLNLYLLGQALKHGQVPPE
jgi:hypothetical protein